MKEPTPKDWSAENLQEALPRLDRKLDRIYERETISLPRRIGRKVLDIAILVAQGYSPIPPPGFRGRIR